MDNVIKSFLTLFCVLMFFFTMSGIIYAAVGIKNAEGYAAAVTQEISECDFAEDVITSLQHEAKVDKYTLDVQPVDVDNDRIPDMAYVTLDYRVRIPFFGYESKVHHIRKIAR